MPIILSAPFCPACGDDENIVRSDQESNRWECDHCTRAAADWKAAGHTCTDPMNHYAGFYPPCEACIAEDEPDAAHLAALEQFEDLDLVRGAVECYIDDRKGGSDRESEAKELTEAFERIETRIKNQVEKV